MAFITLGKKEIPFTGQKVARQIKIWDDNGRLFMGKGNIQIISEVIDHSSGDVYTYRDLDAISKVSLSQIPHDTLLKTNAENTEHITFAQLFQAICDMTDKIWGGQFKKI